MTQADVNWSQIWQQAQSDPYMRVAAALMLLNGLRADQIANLQQATIDTGQGWITTHDGHTMPLAAQTVDALVTSPMEPGAQRLKEAADAVRPLEEAARRRMAGALWLTDDDHHAALELMGGVDAPILPLEYTFPFSVTERLQPGETSEVADRARIALQMAADWLLTETLEAEKPPILARVVGLLRQGSFIFLVASTGVSGLNMIHNVLMGRLLSPADYSQLALIITLQLLVGLLPSAVGTVVARFTARYNARDDLAMLARLQRQTRRFSVLAGIAGGVLLLVLSPFMVSVFRLQSIWLLVPVVAAVPFFIAMGADRGLLQGLDAYWWLSLAYVAEGVVRLAGSVILGYALLSSGRALDGAVWGVAQSMAITWVISWLAVRHIRFNSVDTIPEGAGLDLERGEWVRLGYLTGLVLIGQALITNSDFLLVKNFFSAEEAGLYAAVSVMGRIVYFGALPLTIVLVPLIARRQALNEPTRPILLLLIGGGVAVCGVLVALAAIFSAAILGLLYGEAYVSAAALLAPYALAASLYTMTNLLITYQIALGSGGETWMPILAGILQIIAVVIFHESLAQVITVQIVLMGLLFAVVLWRVLRLPDVPEPVEPALLTSG